MRLLILATVTALAFAGCRNNDQHDNTMNIDENLTAENIVANDVTAIDAVTGDAAHMGADRNYTEADNSLGNDTNAAAPTSRTKPSPKAPSRPPLEQPSPPERSSNSSTNATE